MLKQAVNQSLPYEKMFRTVAYRLRSSRQEVFCGKMFLEISQNSQESASARVSFAIATTLLKKRLWYRCFTVNFVKFLRTPFLKEHLWWLLRSFSDQIYLSTSKYPNKFNKDR